MFLKSKLKGVVRRIKYFNENIPYINTIFKLSQLIDWNKNKNFGPPSPHFIKQSVLLRHAIKNSKWVETGTYLGSTTSLLSEKFRLVHTIEPSKECLKIAKANLKGKNNIIFHYGTSEECLENICKSLSGDICFWLDGHFSSGITFKGDKETPIKYELETISKYIKNFNNVLILIDDIRSSHIDKDNYPSLDFYVDWANSNQLKWTIEHDIFVIKSNELIMYP